MSLGVTLTVVLILIWLLPAILIGRSDKTRGGEKAAWIVAVVCISWFGWVFYLLLAPIKLYHTDHLP